MMGVDVPGLLEWIERLMFVDDQVLLVNGLIELQTSLNRTSKWLELWA